HFRWQAVFQRVEQPLFVLSRTRRILFVNRAWEELTGIPASEARGLVCTRRELATKERPALVARLLCPPPEVLKGKSAHARCQVDGLKSQTPGWWDIEFFPLPGKDSVACILGKITGVPLAAGGERALLPEALKQLHAEAAKGLSTDEAA